MLYIITLEDAETLTEKEQNALKELTAKDKIIFLNREGENISIPLFMFLNTLKCRTEFAPVYKKTEENRNYILFLQAVILSKCEEAVFYTHHVLELPKECPLKIMDSFIVKGNKNTPKRKRKSEEKTAALENNEPLKQKEEVKTEEKEDSNGGLYAELVNIPELSDEKEYVRLNLGKIEECLKKSTDANIGFPFNLQLMFGKERGEWLAKILVPKFDRLKRKL